MSDVPELFMGDEDIPIPARKPKPPAPEPSSRAASEQSQEDDQTTIQWLRGVGTGAVVKIKLYRISPKVWDGHQMGGHIADFDEPFDEDEIRTRFGGGKFQVKVENLTPKGRWQYAGARTIEIAGDPKITPELTGGYSSKNEPAPVVQGEDTTMSRKAMETMERIATDSAARARELEDEARSKSAFDPTLLNMLTQPLNARLDAAEREAEHFRRALADKDTRIMELITKKPETTIQDTLLGKMFDSESTRIESIRVQHESERRQLIEAHKAELESSRSYFRQEMQMKENSHIREIQSAKDTQEARIDSIKSGYEGRLDVLKGRISDLERQLAKAEAEIVDLRGKKEKSVFEQMEDMAKVKNAMETYFGKEEAEEKGSTIERIIGGVIESPIAQAIAGRMQNAPALQPQMDPRMMQRAMRRPVAQPGQQANPGQQQQAQPPAPPKKKLPQFDPLEVTAARSFIENAIRSGADPEEFARGAASVLPGKLMEAIKEEGIDQFLTRVVKPEAGSPLTTMQGKNFLKKALKILAPSET